MFVQLFLLVISIQLTAVTTQANFAEALDKMIQEQNPKMQVSDLHYYKLNLFMLFVANVERILAYNS